MNNHSNIGLSYSARKALTVQLGEAAGTEIANLIQRMAAQIEELKRTKVNVTHIAPGSKHVEDHVASAIESEVF